MSESARIVDYRIVPFREEYLDAFCSLYPRIWAHSSAYRELFSETEAAQTARELTELWLLLRDDQVVGFAGGMPLVRYRNAAMLSELLADPRAAYYLDELGIDPELQGAGLGKRILEHAVESVRASGFRTMILKTTTDPSNYAPRLYSRQGFQVLREMADRPVTKRVTQPRVDAHPEADDRVYFYLGQPTDLRNPSQTVADPAFVRAVARGLLAGPGQRRLPCEYFYDAEGAELFARICDLPEYYPTRTEEGIIDANIDALVDSLEGMGALVELGPGDGRKTRRFLSHQAARSGLMDYIPIDIARQPLEKLVAQLAIEYPSVRILPIADDYLPGLAKLTLSDTRSVVLLWLGTAVGNLEPAEAQDVLRACARAIGPNGALVLGADLKKDPAVLESAYNDVQGVTASFNLNILRRINRELGADFDLGCFEHRAFYDEVHGRIEMHLVSRGRQRVWIDGLRVAVEFAEGESIHTENSYKFSSQDMDRLAAAAGMRVRQRFVDGRAWFSVNVLVPTDGEA